MGAVAAQRLLERRVVGVEHVGERVTRWIGELQHLVLHRRQGDQAVAVGGGGGELLGQAACVDRAGGDAGAPDAARAPLYGRQDHPRAQAVGDQRDAARAHQPAVDEPAEQGARLGGDAVLEGIVDRRHDPVARPTARP